MNFKKVSSLVSNVFMFKNTITKNITKRKILGVKSFLRADPDQNLGFLGPDLVAI